MTQRFAKQLYNNRYLAARAYRNAALSIAASNWTQIVIDTVSYDPWGIVDTTNGRILPTKSGYYFTIGNATIGGMPTTDSGIVSFYFNGVVAGWGERLGTDVTTTLSCVGTDLRYFDGVDDYIELWAYQTYTASRALVLDAAYNFLAIVGPF